MDDDYYRLIHEGKRKIESLSVLDAKYLIPLKAKAWIKLLERFNAGENVDEKNIRKHKNDVFRLYQLLSVDSLTILPEPIRQDLKKFLNEIENKDSVDLKYLGIKTSNYADVLNNLRQIYSALLHK